MADQLDVLWREPTSGRRHIIGALSRSRDGYRFNYEAAGIDALRPLGFRELPEFPEVSRAYEGRYLFSTFAQRVPSPRRPDFDRLMRAWRVERADDAFEILAHSGGLLATDRLELAYARTADDPLDQPLFCRIAGGEHYAESFAGLASGDELTLFRETTNQFDQFAVQIRRADGRQVGWVPKQYSSLVSRLLASGVTLSASVVGSLQLPSITERLLVEIRRAA